MYQAIPRAQEVMKTIGIHKLEENMNRIVQAMLLTTAAVQASL